MNIDISKLLNFSQNEIIFEEKINIDQDYIKSTDIRSISPISVSGYFKREFEDLIVLKMSIKGNMILPCSISLLDVDCLLDIEVYEALSEDNEEYLNIVNNSVDIMPIIWQNIILEIPLKVISPDLDKSKLVGQGWKLKDEDIN